MILKISNSIWEIIWGKESSTKPCFPNFIVPVNHMEILLKYRFLLGRSGVDPENPPFLISSQVMLMLLVYGPHSEWEDSKQLLKLFIWEQSWFEAVCDKIDGHLSNCWKNLDCWKYPNGTHTWNKNYIGVDWKAPEISSVASFYTIGLWSSKVFSDLHRAHNHLDAAPN